MKSLQLRQMRCFIRSTLLKPPYSAVFSSTSRSQPPSLSDVVTTAGAVAELADDVDIDYDRMAAAIPAMMPTPLQPRVVVFDGVCPLCHSGVKWVIRADKDRKIKFCCLQSKTAEPYMKLCGVEREDVLRRFIFVEGLGQYHQASTAALKVLSYLPLPFSALSSLLIIPTAVRDTVYDYIAKRHYDWFGMKDKCLVLKEPEMLERFVDREEILEQHQSDI